VVNDRQTAIISITAAVSMRRVRLEKDQGLRKRTLGRDTLWESIFESRRIAFTELRNSITSFSLAASFDEESWCHAGFAPLFRRALESDRLSMGSRLWVEESVVSAECDDVDTSDCELSSSSSIVEPDGRLRIKNAHATAIKGVLRRVGPRRRANRRCLEEEGGSIGSGPTSGDDVDNGGNEGWMRDRFDGGELAQRQEAID